MSIRFTAVCLAVAGLLASCVSYPDYPDRWAAPLEAQDACAALAGSYEDVGAFGNSDEYTGRAKPKLRHYFFKAEKALEDLERVEFEFGLDRVLHVRGFTGENLLSETRFSEKEGTLICSENDAEISSYDGVSRSAGNPLVGYEYSSIVLLKAEDSSLIVKSRSGGFGMVYLFLPMAADGHHWYRFPASQ